MHTHIDNLLNSWAPTSSKPKNGNAEIKNRSILMATAFFTTWTNQKFLTTQQIIASSNVLKTNINYGIFAAHQKILNNKSFQSNKKALPLIKV